IQHKLYRKHKEFFINYKVVFKTSKKKVEKPLVQAVATTEVKENSVETTEIVENQNTEKEDK
ncbi:MAG: hypothetical protein MJ193_00475, partial [Clostridia bacterium]|nr:hypothetical protein [Clostridia bacterium]